MKTNESPFPVYEFTLLPDNIRPDAMRFARGEWLPYDGSPDVAFIVPSESMAYGVDLPYYRNLRWKWTVGHWSSFVAEHPRGNAWHYSLADGETEWGRSWDRDRHHNRCSLDRAMGKVAAQMSCANGRGPEFNLNDPYMVAGLVRVRETGVVVIPPSEPLCMYCGHEWLAKAKP